MGRALYCSVSFYVERAQLSNSLRYFAADLSWFFQCLMINSNLSDLKIKYVLVIDSQSPVWADESPIQTLLWSLEFYEAQLECKRTT